MPRAARQTLLPGYPLHVLQRGHNRSPVFGSEAEHGLYLGLLHEYSKRYSCAIHAYVLMSNHIHMLVTPSDIPALSALMRDVNKIYGQSVNRKNGRCGSVWQGRFKASLVDSKGYFLTCQRYIEMNPVRAGMVLGPDRYPWSSYAANADGVPSPLIAPHSTYLGLGSTAELRQAVYRGLFRAPISEEAIAQIRAAIQRNKPLGDEEFVREIECRQGEAAGRVGPVPYLVRT